MSQQKPSSKKRESSREPWPFSAAAFLVNRLARQVNEGGKATTDIYGLKCSASFARLDLAGSWRKTCGGFSQLTLDGHSEEYLQTWPKMGIVLDGYASALEMSERPTSGNGFLLWPTATANKQTSNCADPNDLVDAQGNPWQPGKKPHDRRTGKQVTTTLQDFVRHWPTPHANCSTGPGAQGRQGGENLQTAVMWPTPTSCTGNNAGRLDEWGGKGNPTRGTEEGKGQLNPAWVTLLMGFPPGWLDIDGPPGQGHSIPGNRRGLQPG